MNRLIPAAFVLFFVIAFALLVVMSAGVSGAPPSVPSGLPPVADTAVALHAPNGVQSHHMP